MPINAAIGDCGHLINMTHFSNQSLDPVSHTSKIAERLLAHARLCRQIAGESWNEATAAKLAQMADECDRAVAGIVDASAAEPGKARH